MSIDSYFRCGFQIAKWSLLLQTQLFGPWLFLAADILGKVDDFLQFFLCWRRRLSQEQVLRLNLTELPSLLRQLDHWYEIFKGWTCVLWLFGAFVVRAALVFCHTGRGLCKPNRCLVKEIFYWSFPGLTLVKGESEQDWTYFIHYLGSGLQPVDLEDYLVWFISSCLLRTN